MFGGIMDWLSSPAAMGGGQGSVGMGMPSRGELIGGMMSDMGRNIYAMDWPGEMSPNADPMGRIGDYRQRAAIAKLGQETADALERAKFNQGQMTVMGDKIKQGLAQQGQEGQQGGGGGGAMGGMGGIMSILPMLMGGGGGGGMPPFAI